MRGESRSASGVSEPRGWSEHQDSTNTTRGSECLGRRWEQSKGEMEGEDREVPGI